MEIWLIIIGITKVIIIEHFKRWFNYEISGNNLIEDDVQDVDEGIDLLNDNLEDLAQLLEDNVNLIENNNDLRIEIAQVIEEPPQVVAEPGQEANNDPNEIIELEVC